MADATELQKIQQTLDYFSRYYEFDSSIKTLKENRLQLEKYIQTKHAVESKMDVEGKTKKSMIIAAAAAVVGALIVLLVTGFSFSVVSILVAAAVAVVLGAGLFIGLKTYLKKQVDQKWAEQQKANEDLQRQISDIDERCRRLDDQKNVYLDGLDEKGLVVIPSKYIVEAEKIADYVREDKCATAAEAVKMFEENQVRLREKALADRKKRDEEARQRAEKLELQRRERQKELEMQRALEEQMRESALEKERAAAEEAEEPQKSGLSMSLGGKKPQEPKPMPKPERIPAPEPVKAQPVAPTPAQPEEEKPHGGLSLTGKKGEHKPQPQRQRMSQPVRTVPQQPTEEAKPQEERAQRYSGLSLSGRNDAKKKRPAPVPAPKPKNAPIHLVDEPDDNIVDEETTDLENMMKDLLSPSHNSSPLFKNPIHKDVAPARDVPSVPQEDDFDELAFLDEPKAAKGPTVSEVPVVPEESVVPEVPTVPEVTPEEPPAAPEEPPEAPAVPTEPKAPEVPPVPEEPAVPEEPKAPTEPEPPQEPPKSIGWAMAKKK